MSVGLTIARFQLRRERIVLPIWILGILGLFAGSGVAVAREFSGEDERLAIAAIAAGSPAFLFLRGLPDGSSIGSLVFFQAFAFLSILTALANTFFVVRQTRADEERGRAELLESTRIARTLTLRTTLLIAVALNVVIAAAISALGLLLGFEPRSAAVTGLAVGSVGLAFAGVAAVASQIMPSSRSANGLAASLVGAAYLVRGIGDALGTATTTTHVEPSWLSFLSPIGWAQASAPFSSATAAPLLVPIALGLATGVLALVIRAHRDLGASLLRERPGRETWATASTLNLALRLQRSTIIGWAAVAAFIGAAAGLVSPLVATAVESNRNLVELIGKLAPSLNVDVQSMFVVALMGIAGFLAAAAGVQAIIRLRADETEDRAEFLLATPLTRDRWLMTQVGVALASMLTVAATAGVASGLGFMATGGEVDRLGSSLAAVAVHLPAGLVFVALTALVFALLPRATAALGWGLLVVGLVVGQLGELVGLPEWVQNLSPFKHVPAVPLEAVDPLWIVLFLAISVVLLLAAVVSFRRRDIPVG